MKNEIKKIFPILLEEELFKATMGTIIENEFPECANKLDRDPMNPMEIFQGKDSIGRPYYIVNYTNYKASFQKLSKKNEFRMFIGDIKFGPTYGDTNANTLYSIISNYIDNDGIFQYISYRIGYDSNITDDAVNLYGEIYKVLSNQTAFFKPLDINDNWQSF